MNERSKSDLLFEEDEEFIDALEEALDKLTETSKTRKKVIREMHHSDYYKDTDRISLKTDEDEDPPLLIF